MKKLFIKVLNISSLVLVIFAAGCASEPFATDAGSAAVLHSDRQNVEFQEKGVPRKGPSMTSP